MYQACKSSRFKFLSVSDTFHADEHMSETSQVEDQMKHLMSALKLTHVSSSETSAGR